MYQDGVAGGDGPVYAFQDVGLLHQRQQLGGLVRVIVDGQSYTRDMGFKGEIARAIHDQGKVLGLGGCRVAQEQARYNLVTRGAGDRTGQTEQYILAGDRKRGGGAASTHVDPVSTHVDPGSTRLVVSSNATNVYTEETTGPCSKDSMLGTWADGLRPVPAPHLLGFHFPGILWLSLPCKHLLRWKRQS